MICYRRNILSTYKEDESSTKDIEFKYWIFWKTFNTKIFDYQTDNHVRLYTFDWKYWEIKDDNFISEYKNVIDCGFANFMVDFINIRDLPKYLDQFEIHNSFGINKQIIK